VDQILVFDLWGQYGHYKKIFATTSALTYPIPVKTSLYGMFGAMMGLEKKDNAYLKYFQPGQCKVGIQIMAPLTFQQININLRAVFGAMKPTDNRKPTMMEFVYRPRYRIFVTHTDGNIFADLQHCVQDRAVIFTPTLGLANLLANFEYVGTFPLQTVSSDEALPIQTVFPRRQLIQIDHSQAFSAMGNRIMEVSQYAMEMDTERNVTDRDDIILDQHGQPILAKVREAVAVDMGQTTTYAVLF
jgi:CRISPR-associated protein Cas5h